VNDAIYSWLKGATGTITGYLVTPTRNGTPLTPITVPATAAQDVAGYSLDFANATGVTPSPGDVIGGTVLTLDATDSLQSAAVNFNPSAVTIPSSPVAPGVPQTPTLTLS
jgi:hypothetical protein